MNLLNCLTESFFLKKGGYREMYKRTLFSGIHAILKNLWLKRTHIFWVVQLRYRLYLDIID